MALTNKLTAIADAIREKTGSTAPLFLDAMPSHIRSIQTTESDTTGIPDYVVTEGKRVASGMISKRGANSITAVIMSDMHEFGDNDHSDATIMERYRRANRNAGQGAKVIADNIDIDFFANLGDLAWGAKTSTVTDFVQSIVNARKYMYDVEKDHETFITPGNHDTATYGFAKNNEYLSQSVMDGLTGTYRYVDFTSKKVRVICLNTAEVEGLTVSGQSGTERITGTQLQWFADALDLSAKSDAASWGIIILSHHPLDWGAILPAANCLQAYLTGGSFSVTHNGVAVSKNFSGKNAAKVICQFHGHVHGFRVDDIRHGSAGSLTATTVKRIAIPNACFARTNEYGENTGVDSNGIEFGETTSYDKVDGTAENTAFCLVSIDLDNEVIYADCYGAGYDRVISYAEEVIVTYSVTNNLTNATSSNGTSTVTEGSNYSAAITSNDGYKLSSVKVTMGGVDITATAVNGSNISITNVTGDIIITVIAVLDENPETGTYTNLVPTSVNPTDGTTIFNSPYGYQNGTYVSGVSSPSNANCTSTGAILLTNDVNAIYIRGAKWDTSNAYVRFYAGSLGTMNSYAIKADGSGTHKLSSYFDFEELGTNYYKLALTSNGKNLLAGRYYRISLVGTGENLIITHDQPIPQDATGGGTATTYTVTNTLTNVTTSNSTASVIGGVSYSATLTAKSGYTLTGGTVKVTMGGTDITSSAYSNGKIAITQVTGNIVITASAVVEQSTTTYTNQVPISTNYNGSGIFNGTGYMNNYYATTDAPYYKADTQGCCVTGLIPYNSNSPKTIYIKGVTFTTAKSHNRIGFFKGGVCKTTPGVSELSTYFTITTLGTNYYKLEPKMSSAMTTWGYDGGIIISAYGDGANMIVTLDEAIE